MNLKRTFYFANDFVIIIRKSYELRRGIQHIFFFFKLGFTPCKAKQPLRGMELQERKHEKKITGYRKSV